MIKHNNYINTYTNNKLNNVSRGPGGEDPGALRWEDAEGTSAAIFVSPTPPATNETIGYGICDPQFLLLVQLKPRELTVRKRPHA